MKADTIGIHSAHKPTEGKPLSGVAIFLDKKGTGYFHIKVYDDVIDKLGKKMPYGIGPENTAYIKVVHHRDVFEVWCVYLDRSKRVKLCETSTLPKWVKRVKYTHEN